MSADTKSSVARLLTENRRFRQGTLRMLTGAEPEASGEWTNQPPHTADLSEIPDGLGTSAMMPLSGLQAAGWGIVPVPHFYSVWFTSRDEPAKIRWRNCRWAAIPPATSNERARIFPARGGAQMWASEHCAREPRP